MKTKKSLLIDSHQHVFWHRWDDAGLIADMDAYGIDHAWLLSWIAPQNPVDGERTLFTKVLNPARARDDGSHPGILLEDLLIAQRNYPERFILGYCPDPAIPDAVERFESACEMYGVRVCGEWKFRMHIDDPRCIEMFRAAARRKAPVVLHLDVPYLPSEGVDRDYQPNWYGGTVENLERALQLCPDTKFIGHAPGFWREICGGAGKSAERYPKGNLTQGGKIETLFERYSNLYADLSAGSALVALQRDDSFARYLLEKHASRILFGRDQYGGSLLEYLRKLKLPSTTMEQILYKNSLELVPLSGLSGLE